MDRTGAGRAGGRACVRGSAPGRLDLLGGVADYSGALVLEMPTRQGTEVVAEPDDALVVGPPRSRSAELERLARCPTPRSAGLWRTFPRWTHYVLGVALVLVRHGVIDPPRARLVITSDLPASVGVASSAALEVATARALGRRRRSSAPGHAVPGGGEPRRRRTVRDHGPGRRARRDTRARCCPILCRPAEVGAPVAAAVGPRGRRLADRSGARRRRPAVPAGPGRGLHGQAHGGGSRAGRSWSWVSELPADAAVELPEELDGSTFLERWGSTDDDVTVVEPDEILSGPGRHHLRRRGARAERGRAGGAAPTGEPDAPRPADGGQPGRVRRHGPRAPGGDADRRRRRWPVPACTAHDRAAAGVAARSWSCASEARWTTSRA